MRADIVPGKGSSSSTARCRSASGLDLRAVLQRCRPDWNIDTPEQRAAWEKADKANFFQYGRTLSQFFAEE